MVGVATGPESHNPCCGVRDRTFSDDGLTIIRKDAETHRIHTRYEDGRGYWECSCGWAGNAADYDHNVDIASDRHIDYDAGEHRVDTNRPF